MFQPLRPSSGRVFIKIYVPGKVNNNGERGLSLISVVVLPCVPSINVAKYFDYHGIITC